MTDQSSISHGERAAVAETSADSLVPPGATPYEGDPEVEPGAEVARLSRFLEDTFPEETARSNRQVPEQPVDVAIRLLRGLSTSGTRVRRCPTEYCNQPVGHAGPHRWAHFQ